TKTAGLAFPRAGCHPTRECLHYPFPSVPGGLGSGAAAFSSVRIEPVLLAIMFERHLAVPPRPIHRLEVRINEHLDEMPPHDRPRSQEGLTEVDPCSHIEPPSRHRASHRDFAHSMIPVLAITIRLHTSAQYSAFSAYVKRANSGLSLRRLR